LEQRAFRVYDFDGHILEIAENMDIVFKRMFQENKSSCFAGMSSGARRRSRR
jgi:hypothetical protein